MGVPRLEGFRAFVRKYLMYRIHEIIESIGVFSDEPLALFEKLFLLTPVHCGAKYEEEEKFRDFDPAYYITLPVRNLGPS
jgi:hypothetical protein